MMSFPIFLLYFYTIGIIAINIINAADVSRIRLNAVTDILLENLHKLYRNERNEDPPFEWDLATTDESYRQRTCDDISSSGIFRQFGYRAVNMRKMHSELKEPRYADIFRQLYRFEKSSKSYKYTNAYTLREFDFASYISDNQYAYPVTTRIKEYMFVCLIKRRNLNDIIHYYVSKAYHLPIGYRFVFPEKEGNIFGPHTSILLAERSAEVYIKPYFNVETHYLELRKHHEPVPRAEEDPVCKLNTPTMEDHQLIRLCETVLSSSYFKNKVRYRRPIFSTFCYRVKITFRTPDGVRMAASESYNELMVRCFGDTFKPDDSQMFYISRAYNPNQVFVYQTNPFNDNINLEILSTNISIVHERYNFGAVET